MVDRIFGLQKDRSAGLPKGYGSAEQEGGMLYERDYQPGQIQGGRCYHFATSYQKRPIVYAPAATSKQVGAPAKNFNGSLEDRAKFYREVSKVSAFAQLQASKSITLFISSRLLWSLVLRPCCRCLSAFIRP